LSDLVQLPEPGYALYWNEEQHAYRRANNRGGEGARMPAVTTIAKAFPDRPDPLMYWAERTTLEGVSRLSAAQRHIPDDPWALRKVLEGQELRWPQVRDKRAERGIRAHTLMLEALARGGAVPDLADLPEDERGYGQAVFRWWQKRKPEPINVEQIVLSKEHGYAGRFDLRCNITGTLQPCSGTGIVDLKTGKGVYRADHIQLCGYDIAARECGIGAQHWLMLLHVRPDGSYAEHYCAAEEWHFMLALASYQAAKEVDKRMNGG
jgi:hypothetical protein